MEQIRACIGSIPIIDPDSGDGSSPLNEEIVSTKSPDSKSPVSASFPKRVLADGTYATESAYSTVNSRSTDVKKPFYRQPLRGKIHL